MRVALIVPAPFETISGGYGYDRRIVAGLRAAGHAVKVLELPGVFPLADEITRNAACAAWDALADATPVIDGLALPALQGMDDAIAARRAVALIHHPTSLETGLGDTERDRLRAVEQRLMSRMTRVIVTSDATAEQLVSNFGVARNGIAVVMPGTDDAPRGSGARGATCEILSIGTLVPRKGHDLLLRALARLFDLDWHLTIVGSPLRDPAHARALHALAEELHIARQVSFAGEMTGGALEALWQRADLFALASQHEGYGMAMAEALKRGIPVAVTAVGIAPALVTPQVGMLVQPGDRDTLSKSLRRVIFSPELRRDMAEAAWHAGQALPSWETQARAFADALAMKD